MKNNKSNRGAETIPQFYICEYINSHYEEGSLELEFVSRCTIRATEASGDRIYFTYDESTGEIKTEKTLGPRRRDDR